MQPPLLALFGMPRSGSTWIGKIFDSDPRVLYLHEPDGRGELNFMPLFSREFDDPAAAAGLQRFVAALPARREEKVSASLPRFRKSHYTEFGFQAQRAIVMGSKLLSRWRGPVTVPDPLRRPLGPESRVVWKSIESLGRLGSVMRLLPGARAVLLMRHPCGYVASVMRGEAKGKFDADTPTADDWGLFEALASTPAARAAGLDLPAMRSLSPVQRLACRWALYYEHALTETASSGSLTMIVRYEDVCAEPLAQAARLLAHAGLDLTDQTRDFIAVSTGTSRAEYYSVFKNPIESANGWRRQLSPQSVCEVMDMVSRFESGRHYRDEAAA